MLFANTSGALVPGAAPVVRCAVPPSAGVPYERHFLDGGEGCAGGAGVAEETVGFAAGSRTGGWASALGRCFHAAAATQPASPPFWYHTVHAGPHGRCAPGDALEATLGFVI